MRWEEELDPDERENDPARIKMSQMISSHKVSSHQRRFAVAQYDWGSTHWAYVRLTEGWYLAESSYAFSMQSAENVVLTMYLGDGVMEE